MPVDQAFHEVRFPSAISRRAQGGPERRTEIVTLGSGHEQRNSRWAHSRRRYDAGYGVRSLDDIYAVAAFYEERRGRLYGFRWRDHADFKSCPPQQTPSPLDCEIGIGDGLRTTFQLTKRYGRDFAPYSRVITKPVDGSVEIALAGVALPEGAFVCDPTTGIVTFAPAHVPPAGALVTAGFLFDVPVRFDTDTLEISLEGQTHGAIPNIPIIEVRP